jgi:hypothetical protein
VGVELALKAVSYFLQGFGTDLENERHEADTHHPLNRVE